MLRNLQNCLARAAYASAMVLAVGVGSATLTAKADDADRFLGVVDKPVQDTGTPIRYGVTLVGVSSFYQILAVGIVIIVAVMLDRVRRREVF